MEETILCPSPNWFLPSVLSVSGDGWLVYGGPGRCLVVLEPLPSEFEGVIDNTHRHKAHVVHKCHYDKVATVDISPDWPEKRHFVTGSPDGAVKEWTITKVDKKWAIKNIHSHEAHDVEKEEVIGVGYSKTTTTATHVVSVGSFSNVVLWELNTNTTKTYGGFMRHFKATCMSCSPHLPLVVAVGTKQGVVFVLDLNGKGNIVYKVRGQDDEISQVSWCPQYEVVLKRSFLEKKSLATKRLEQIRNEPEPSSLDTSGAEKKLPDDSFDESITSPEDDMFDIYKDHEVNEFGHKKYQPEEIVVKKKVDSEKEDFLAECERLKNQILKNKQEDDQSIASLVEAMDKTHVDSSNKDKCQNGQAKEISGVASLAASSSRIVQVDGTDHVHKHLLASISKNGFSVRIWSKTGKIIASCAVQILPKHLNKNQANKTPHSASLHWYKADMLLIVDSKTHLLGCNPLDVDCRNRIQWSVLHSEHRRGLYFVTSNSPRVQNPEVPLDESRWSVWTVGQDRSLIKYDVRTHQVLAKYGTCGGFLYDVTPCSYDAGKLAIGVGDGAVRIWETQPTGEEDNKLTLGEISMHWQNVQGKILQCAWHPTKENLLAFSTAESRVGLIDISKADRPAKVLQPGLSHGVYSIAWGEGMTLFAVGGKELVMYKANKPEMAPIPIRIEIEGQVWDMSVVDYSTRGLTLASSTGGVAVFTGPGGRALAAKFVFTRQIQAISWHPQQTTFSDEQSKYRDLLAITSVDRINTVVVIKYEDKEGGGKQFTDFRTLVGHTDRVTQAFWSPHREGMLLSSSMDSTIRVWDVVGGACVSVFDGHSSGTLGVAWCARPQLADKVLSGGNDFCLRLWDINDYPVENYKEVKRIKRVNNKKKSKVTDRNGDEKNAEEDKNEGDVKKDTDLKQQDVNDKDQDTNETDQSDDEKLAEIAVKINNKSRESKRYLLPIVSRQIYNLNVEGIRVMLQKQLDKSKDIKTLIETAKESNPELYDLDYLKLFGTINEVNEVLDMECESHLAMKAYKEYMMLMIFRGRIDSMIQFATERDLLDPFLVSIAPCVSFKYWKDVTQLYIAQLDRLAVKKQEDQVPGVASREYIPLYRKAAALLSIHDIRGAVDMLENMNLFKEAYILCRCRHMDSIAEQVLQKWVGSLDYYGSLMYGALIYVAMGEVSKAATLLRRSNSQENLNFAAELAKAIGLNTFADYMETKVKNAEKESTVDDEKTEELLEELPTKMELLLNDIKDQNGALNAQGVVENGKNNSASEIVTETKE